MRMEGESGAGGSGGMMVVDGGELIEDLTRNRVTCVAGCPEVGLCLMSVRPAG